MEKQISFENEGRKLYGMLHIPKGKGPFPASLLCHGYLSGDRRGRGWWHVKRSRELCHLGIGSLRFDFRGVGESEGEFADFTIHDRISDAKKALEFLLSQDWVNKRSIGVLGFSYGGIVAVNAFSGDSRMKAMALVSTPADPKDVLKLVSSNPQAKDGGFYYRTFHASKSFLESLGKVGGAEILKDFDKPLLIVQGEKDEILEKGCGRQWYKAAETKDKTLHYIKGADHNFTNYHQNAKVRKLINNWFKRVL